MPPEHEASPTRHLAPAQVAELLDLEIGEVMSLIHEGRLHAARMGAPPRWRVEERSVADYVAQQNDSARLTLLWRQAQSAGVPGPWDQASGRS